MYEKSFAEVVAEKIARPLGLSHTYFGNSIEIEDNEADSYVFFDEWQRQPATDMSVSHGAGAMVSTAKETNQFLSALFAGKLVSEASLNAMMTLEDNYGLGLFVAPFHQHKFYGHNGRIDGFSSAAGYNPLDGTTITVLSNGVNYNFNDVLIAVLSSIYDRDFDIPDFSAKPLTLSLNIMKKAEGTFSSKEIALEIKFWVESNQLMAQASGQGAFPLPPYSETEYRFEPAGIVIQFDADSEKNGRLNGFVLKQGGGKYGYRRR